MRRIPEIRILDVATASTHIRHLLEAAGVAQVAVVPLVAGQEFYGVVTAPIDESTAAEVDLLERLQGMADHAAVALHNSRLLEQVRHQASHDGLTGLPNRTLLADRAEQALTASRRDGTRVQLLFLDLDDFKVVNDTLGHAAGDAVLQHAGQRLVRALRASDTVARVGGDEFAVLMTHSAASGGGDEMVVEKVREHLREELLIGDRTVHVSASVGIATAGEDDNFETLLARADSAMYRVKLDRRHAI
jgi:diguanylate cyclase (GGDEF)-like protein